MSLKESIGHKEVAASAVCQDQGSRLPPGGVPALNPQPGALWAVIWAQWVPGTHSPPAAP